MKRDLANTSYQIVALNLCSEIHGEPVVARENMIRIGMKIG